MRGTTGFVLVAAAALLTACGAGTEEQAGKQWPVDSSGWWVPSDPVGCLEETTTCHMNAWPTRAYVKGGSLPNVFLHGDVITLECKAPTPAAIFNSVKTESKYWYYSEFKGKTYWVPDIYVTKDAVDTMAEGVPDCTSDTPGI